MDDLKIIIDPCQEGTLQRNYSRSIGRILRERLEGYSPKEREVIYKKLLEKLKND